jgi:hypothetical protein
MSDRDRIRDALHFISAANRETWVRTGMAVKSELGDAGFEVWDAWSQQADSYNAKDARDIWKSIRANGKVTAGTLFHEAKTNGWRDDGTHRKPTPEELEARRGEAADRTAKEEVEERARHEAAAARAAEILAAATSDPATHPYAIKKGVPFGPLVRRGLWPQRGWTDALLVPIYGGDDHVWSIEAINADGSKDSLKDALKRGGFHPLGTIRSASRVLIAEGLANAAVGWAVDGSPGAAAMGKSNLLHTALAARKLAPEAEIIILADNTLNVPREAQDAARAVGGQVAVPDLGGRKCDFWDLWHERGVEAVRAAISDTRASDGATAASEDEEVIGREFPCEPLVPIEIDLDLHGKPSLNTHMDETEVAVHKVEIEMQTLAPSGLDEGTSPLEAEGEGAAGLKDGKDTHPSSIPSRSASCRAVS